MNIEFKKYKNFPKISTGLILVAFFMPFFLIKCGGTTIASVSGVDMIVGTEVGKGSDTGEIRTNIFGILAALMAVAGIILAWIGTKKFQLYSLIVACVGMLCLIVMYISLQGLAGEQEAKGIITISLGFGFYLAFIGFLCNSLFFGLWMKDDKKTTPTISNDTVDDVI